MAIANAVDAGTAGFQSLTSGGIWNGRTLTAGAGINITNGDGTAGNPVISATGGSGGVNATLDFWDDFLNSTNSTAAGDTEWETAGIGVPVAVAGHPGTLTFPTSGAASIIKGGTTAPTVLLGGGILTVTFYIKLNSLTTYTIVAGLFDAPSTDDPVNGVYFRGQNGVNSGNWEGKTSSSSVRSTASSSTAIGTGWTVLQIVVNAAASSVAFYVGSTLAGLTQIANSPLTTNIPTAAISPGMGFAAGASGSAYVDLITMTYALTTAR